MRAEMKTPHTPQAERIFFAVSGLAALSAFTGFIWGVVHLMSEIGMTLMQ
ncbi:hypothetical protein TB147_17955 [Klebsiella aerogenes]|nr:hypothetical protein [Klebsiella aerogenes]MED7793189.1 hypothetical protein [Klebsiella aerogenes]